MSKRHHRLALLLLLLLICSSGVHSQSNADDAAARLIGEILTHGEAFQNLRYLVDEIGARLTGTPACARAEAWTAEKFKAYGLSNVHREEYTLFAGWRRGRAYAEVVEPVSRTLSIASFTWVPSTPEGGLTTRVVDIHRGTKEDVARATSRLRGAIALTIAEGETLEDLLESFYRIPALVRELTTAGTRALVVASQKPYKLLDTAPVFWNEVSPIPVVSMAKEDALFLRRLIEHHGAVRLRLQVENRLTGPVKATNVVAEIPGRERPEEVVLVGAHLDSNDLGPCATDNGTGVTAVMEAARALVKLGLRPRRTIRFVLFTGEEQGILGSKAYVDAHADELDHIVANLIMDIGAGRAQGFYSMGRPELEAAIRRVTAPLIPHGVRHISTEAFAGTDNLFFLLQGVPNLVMMQDPLDYFTIHHSTPDTLDKVNPGDLLFNAAVLAVTAYNIAEQPERFGRRLSPEEVKKLAADSGLARQLRAVGIWK